MTDTELRDMAADAMIGQAARSVGRTAGSAESAGMTLVALVRGDDFEIFTFPERIRTGVAAHVA